MTNPNDELYIPVIGAHEIRWKKARRCDGCHSKVPRNELAIRYITEQDNQLMVQFEHADCFARLVMYLGAYFSEDVPVLAEGGTIVEYL